MRLTLATVLMLILAFPVFAQEEVPPATIEFRVAHFATDVPSIDVYVDGVIFAEELVFTDISDFQTLPAGDYIISFAFAGAPPTDAPLIEFGIEANTVEWFTLSLVGNRSNNTLAINVAATSPRNLGSNTTRVQFVNALENTTIALFGNENSWVELPFNGAFWGTDLEAGSYQVRATMTDDTPLLTQDIAFEPHRNYYITIVEHDGQPQAVVHEANLGANIRLAHFSSDIVPIDLLLNGALVVQGLAYEGVSEFINLPNGTHEIFVIPNGASVDSALLGPITLELDYNTDYTLALTGQFNNQSFELTPIPEPIRQYTDNAAFQRGENAVVNFLHGVFDAPALDVRLADGTVLLAGIAFREGIGRLDLPAGVYDLVITAAGEPETIIFDLSNFALEGGNAYNLAAIGRFDGGQSLNLTQRCLVGC